MKGIGEESEGLYLFLRNFTESKIIVEKGLIGIKEKMDIELWRKQLVHASVGVIKQILGLSQDECRMAIDNYMICPLARHTRFYFPNSASRIPFNVY